MPEGQTLKTIGGGHRICFLAVWHISALLSPKHGEVVRVRVALRHGRHAATRAPPAQGQKVSQVSDTTAALEPSQARVTHGQDKKLVRPAGCLKPPVA